MTVPTLTTILAFAAASVVLIALPGPNLVYIVTLSASQGRRAGLLAAFGVESATLVWIGAAVLGLSAAIAASPTVATTITLIGAGYLGYLAWLALRPAGVGSAASRPMTARRAFRDGFVVNLLNPKVGLFFIAFLPQFVSDGSGSGGRSQMVVLGALFFALALAFDVGYAFVGEALGRRLRQGAHALAHRCLTATVYVGLGVYSAATVLA